MKNIFRNVILYFLTFIMTFTNLINVYAVEGNADNNNSTSGNLGGGGDFSTSAGKFGYRVSLISKQDPELILSANESGEPVVFDFWFCSESQFNQYCFTNSITNLTAENVHSAIKTQTLNTQNKIHRVFIPDEISKRGTDSILAQIPRWLGYEGGRWVTYGKELQSWETENNYQNIARMAVELTYTGDDGKEHLYFQTKDTLNKCSLDGKPLSVLSQDVESNKNIVLLIEPLLLFTPCYYNTSIPIMNKQYGTVTNILESMWDNPTFQQEYKKDKRFNHLNYKLTDVAWCALNLSAEQSFEFENGCKLQQLLNYSEELGLTTYSGAFDWSYAADLRDWDPDLHMKDGWGCNLFWLDGLGIKPPNSSSGEKDRIHTYDITTNPQEDYFTEPSTGKDEGETYPEDKRNKFNVVKYYIYEDDVTGEVTELSYYVTQNAPHTVIIDNEQAQTGFALKEYFTSTDEWLPADGHAPSEYSWTNVVKKHDSGKYHGTDYGTVTVLPEDSDVVLHVLYTFTGKEAVNVVKVYKNSSDEIIKTTGPELAEDSTKYVVEEESGYDYVETLISKADVDVENPNGESTKEKQIVIEQGTKTLYVVYKEPPQQIRLYSNELSYTYDLRDLVKSRVLFEIYDLAPVAPGSRPDCGGHSCGDEDCSKSHKCTNDSKTLTDSIWTLSVTDNYDYANNTSFIISYELSNIKRTGHATYAGGQKASIKPNASFLLIRDKNSDLVTLYPEKNSGLSSQLNDLGITTESYSPANSRIESETIKDENFTRSLSTHFEYASDRDDGLSWRWVRSGRGRHTATGKYNVEVKTDPSGANKYYSNSNNVKEFYLLGQSNSGTEEAVDIRSDSFGTKYSYNKSYISTSSDLKFYPYALMLYRAKNNNSTAQNVYVTSENLSTMKVYNAIQLGVYKKNSINALLSSTQWSTHARSLAFSANTDKKSVIPGGGILDLSMGNKGDTELGIRLWQSCLRDEQVQTVQQDGFNTSLSKAKEIASNYQSEVKQVLEGYGLVQWGTEGVSSDLESILSSGTELHNNTNLNWDGRNYKTSNDSKYYLKHNGSGSDRANFDVLDNKIVKQVFYEISSDVDGNIILKKDNTEIARASLNQDKSAILSNTEAKLLDDNTKLVTNYFNAIDRGLGDKDKYDRTNSRKYNEAFDGVGVLLTDLSFSVGFADTSGHRTTVLDTLLTSTSESKSDLYNFNEDKVRSFVFATTKASTTAQNDKVGYLGSLSGDGTMQSLSSVLSDIQSMVYSKNFYTSNFNVTDLN